MHYYFQALQKWADFAGRATRTEFWAFIILNTIVGMVISSIETYIFFSIAGGLISSVYWFFMVIPSLAVSVRRLHDIGYSGWWFCINFIPVVGGVAFLVMTILPSDKKNKFGAKKR